jgi:hypothetical protein
MVVAGVIGENEARRAGDPDEAGGAAAVRGVHAEGGAVALVAVAGRDEEGIGRSDPRALRWRQAASPDRLPGRDAADAVPLPLSDVLRAVAEGLVHYANDHAGRAVSDAAIHAVAPAGGELDAEDPDIGPRRQEPLERVAGNRPRVDHQRSRVGRGHEAVWAREQGCPRATSSIPGGGDQERQGSVKCAVFLRQEGTHHLAPPGLHVFDPEALLYLPVRPNGTGRPWRCGRRTSISFRQRVLQIPRFDRFASSRDELDPDTARDRAHHVPGRPAA